MKNLLFIPICLTLMLITTIAIGADNYRVGDKLYVWAKSGLNVRQDAGTTHSIITTLQFGDPITVLEKTPITYHVAGITAVDSTYSWGQYSSGKIHPIIFKGNWVKITTASGVSGYVIDQYLLKTKPYNAEKDKELVKVDTLFKSPEFDNGKSYGLTVQYSYPDGIKSIQNYGTVWSSSTCTFPYSSIEEALIHCSAYSYNFEECIVLKNWKEEVIIYDPNSLCTTTFKKTGNVIQVEDFCSC